LEIPAVRLLLLLLLLMQLAGLKAPMSSHLVLAMHASG
jgi:hypothetical protein